MARMTVALALCGLGSCNGDSPSHLSSPLMPSSGRLAFSAVVQAREASAVAVRVFYQRTSDQVDLTRSVIPLPVTGGTQITVDLAACLGDPQRRPATDGACPVGAELILMRDDVELDRTTLGPLTVRPGEDVPFPSANLYEVATVQIVAPPGGALTFEPETTLMLAAIAKDKTGALVSAGKVSWASTNPAVASVNANTGSFTTLSVGVASVTAAVGGRTGQVNIQVVPFAARRVVVTPRTAVVTVGKTVPIAADAFDRKNRRLAGRAMAWTTSNANVATVSATGVVTGVATGTANISATVDGATDTATVSVTPVGVSSVAVSFANSALTLGQTTQATATAKDAAGSSLSGTIVSSWRSSDIAVATVSATGLVTAVGVGTATISATIDGVVGAAAIVVSSPTITSVKVTLISSLTIGQSVAAIATARDANDNPVVGVPVTWTTSDESVATVSPTGVVTGVSLGSGTITASTGALRGSAAVSVTAPSSTFSLTISGAGAGSGTVTSEGIDELPGEINCVITAGSANGACSASFAVGTVVTLFGDPESLSVFVGMTNASCSENTCTVIMTRPRNVVATFAPSGTLNSPR